MNIESKVGNGRLLRLERPVPDRGSACRRRAHDPRRGRSLRGRQARPAHRGSLSRGEDRPGDLPRDGRGRAARHHHSRGIWRAWRRLRDLRPGCARGRARRFRLSLDDERAVVAGDVSDPCLWLGGAAQEISAEARIRRMDRLLRADRARCRLRSRRHEDARREDRVRLSPQRRQDVDLQRADRRRLRRLGEVGSARQPDPRLRAGEGHEGAFGPEDRRQAQPARLDHRRDRDGKRRGRRRCAAAQRVRPEGSVRLSQPRPLRHLLGRDGRCRGLLAPRPAVWSRQEAVRQAARGHPALPEEARRHADRDRARPAGIAARRPADGRRTSSRPR